MTIQSRLDNQHHHLLEIVDAIEQTIAFGAGSASVDLLLDHLTQTPLRDVRVNLGGGYVSMAQHDLDASQVRTAFHQMSGETMPDHVRRQRPADAGL